MEIEKIEWWRIIVAAILFLQALRLLLRTFLRNETNAMNELVAELPSDWVINGGTSDDYREEDEEDEPDDDEDEEDEEDD